MLATATLFGTSEAITNNASKSGDKLFSSGIEQLNGLYDYRADQPNGQAHAVIAPRTTPSR